MVDIFSAIDLKPDDSKRILAHLNQIKEAQAGNGDLSVAINAAMEEFNQFFLNYHEKYFTAHKFLENDTPNSITYNENLRTLANDIDNLYDSLSTVAASSIAAYNYSTISSNEIKKAAEIAASKVLDLNILSDFVKGTTIVAGDDFIDNSRIDTTADIETTQAESVKGASSAGLKPIDISIVSDPNTKIDIVPVMPNNVDGFVNTEPTPDNLKRFYEGKFYAPIGELRPAGGELKLSYFGDPAIKVGSEVSTTVNGVLEGDPIEEQDLEGFFAIVPPSEEAKQASRLKMLDGNPDTFWEAEWVTKTAPLIEVFDNETDEVQNTTVTIDISQAEQIAKQYDSAGQDLMFHILYEFPSEVAINLVTIDPILFGTQAFTEVTDVSTLQDGEFSTVEGFAEQQFDKILTPEANKSINDDLVKKTMAPSQYAYGGVGIFQFPMRFTTKLRVTVLMKDPVPSFYERQYLLMQNTTVDTHKVKKTTKSLF